MQYYPHHIGDFIKETACLNNDELIVYLKMIWMYYDTEQPLPDNIKLLSFKLGCRGNDTLVSMLLEMFFTKDEGVWRNSRCDKEIEKFYASSTAASKAGKASAEKRKEKAAQELIDRSTDSNGVQGRSILGATESNRSQDRSILEATESNRVQDRSILEATESNRVQDRSILEATEFNERSTESNERSTEPNVGATTQDPRFIIPLPPLPRGPRKEISYPPDFEKAWAEYPNRHGGSSKSGAFKAWTARIKAGALADEILAGVIGYRQHLEATGKIGTEFVKQAQTFFGPADPPWWQQFGKHADAHSQKPKSDGSARRGGCTHPMPDGSLCGKRACLSDFDPEIFAGCRYHLDQDLDASHRLMWDADYRRAMATIGRAVA